MSQLNFRDEKNHGGFSHAENIGWLCLFVNLESIQNMSRKPEMKRDHNCFTRNDQSRRPLAIERENLGSAHS